MCELNHIQTNVFPDLPPRAFRMVPFFHITRYNAAIKVSCENDTAKTHFFRGIAYCQHTRCLPQL